MILDIKASFKIIRNFSGKVKKSLLPTVRNDLPHRMPGLLLTLPGLTGPEMVQRYLLLPTIPQFFLLLS